MKKLLQLQKIISSQKGSIKILLYPGFELYEFMAILPFLASLKSQLPQAQIFLLLSPKVDFFMHLFPQVSGSWQIKETYNQEEKYLLKNWILCQGFKIAIQFSFNLRLAFLLWLCRIPWRLGERKNFWAYLFYNVRYNKSNSERLAEYQKNLEVLSMLGLKPNYVFPEILFPKTKKENYWVFSSELFFKYQPGYSWQDFLKLSQNVNKKKVFVFLKEDLPQIEGNSQKILWKKLKNYWQALEILAKAELVISNFNEIALLASLLQIPHLVIYPKALLQSIPKWVTLSFPACPSQQDYLLHPKVDFACKECIGTRCPYWPCTRLLKIDLKKTILSWKIARKENQKLLKKEKKIEKQILKKQKDLEKFLIKLLEENEPKSPNP